MIPNIGSTITLTLVSVVAVLMVVTRALAVVWMAYEITLVSLKI
jgi:hypothetical protein